MRLLDRWAESVAETFSDDTDDVFTFVLLPSDLAVIPKERLFALMEQAGVDWDFSAAQIADYVPEDWA